MNVFLTPSLQPFFGGEALLCQALAACLAACCAARWSASPVQSSWPVTECCTGSVCRAWEHCCHCSFASPS